MLKPCQQWFCDTCNEVIKNPLEGDLRNLTDRDHHHAFRFAIIHSTYECDPYLETDKLNVDYSSYPLDRFIDPDGLAVFLGIQQYEPIKDYQEYLFFVRRLFIPFFEEARLYMEMAVKDYFFERMELSAELPESYEAMVKYYSSFKNDSQTGE